MQQSSVLCREVDEETRGNASLDAPAVGDEGLEGWRERCVRGGEDEHHVPMDVLGEKGGGGERCRDNYPAHDAGDD